jgi:hypothetical protein
MNIRNLLIAIALLAGLASGPSSLESAALSQPPLEWSDLAFVLVGCAVALLLVLGFQALIGNNKALSWGWAFFAFAAIYLIATGASAAAFSVSNGSVGPYSFLFLALGAGSTVGLSIIKLAFASRFKNGA